MTQLSISEAVLATARLYKECAVDASRALVRNWLLLPASFVALLVVGLVTQLFGSMGMAGGFVVGIVNILMVSLYYLWLAAVVDRERLEWRVLAQFDYGMFSAVISVAFVIFIAQFLVSTASAASQSPFPMLLLNLGIFMVCNAIPEVIYIRRSESLQGLAEAAEFTKEHWIEWFLPILVVLLPVIWQLGAASVLIVSSQFTPLFPLLFVKASVDSLLGGSDLLALLVTAVLVNWLMVFRGLLFKGLESGNRRQRLFRERQR